MFAQLGLRELCLLENHCEDRFMEERLINDNNDNNNDWAEKAGIRGFTSPARPEPSWR